MSSFDNAGKGEVTWAKDVVSGEHLEWTRQLLLTGFRKHWSRIFEYPWIFINGDLRVGQRVLDAAGGDAPLQNFLAVGGCKVVNVDLDTSKQPKNIPNIECFCGDLRKLAFPDETFERIVCCSVLEHSVDYLKILEELWRVLAKGGRLLVTLDVAGYRRYNHTIDESVLGSILERFRLSLPPEPEDILSIKFNELEPTKWEPQEVMLRCLCFYADKSS